MAEALRHAIETGRGTSGTLTAVFISAAGAQLVREAQMLAVPFDHPFARRESIAASDLAHVNLVERDGTFQEALTLVGAGQGTLVAAHARRYYARPDIVYVLVSDAPPLEWGLIWPADRNTARVRAFAAAADALVHEHTGHLW